MGRPSLARETLIEVSQKLFWERGYENVSVDDLCRAAGVNKGSFYYFFKTKKALALAANAERWRSMQPMLLFDPEALDPLQNIYNYFKSMVGYQSEMARSSATGFLGCPFGMMGTEMAGIEPEIRTQVQDIFEGHVRFIEQNLRSARKAGLIATGSLQKIARQIFMQWQGALVLARVYNDPAALQTALQFTRKILDGLRFKN